MTESIVRVIDPRIDYARGREGYIAQTGAKNWEIYHIPASGYSNSSITFANITSIGESRVYEDTFSISYDVTTTVTTNIPGYFINGASKEYTGIGLTMFPLHQVSQSVAININGQRLTSVPRDTLQARSRFWPQERLNKILMDCPVQKNPSVVTCPLTDELYTQSTVTGYTNAGNTIPYPNAITNNGSKGTNNVGLKEIISSVADGVYTFQFIWHVTEPILCQPFNSNLFEQYGKPIWNISQLEITYWMEDLNRMVSLDGYFTKSALLSQITAISSPVLNFRVANTNEPPPPTYITPYYEYVPFPTQQTSSATVATGSTFNITSGVYTLSYIPQQIYVFVAHSQSTTKLLGAPADQQCMAQITHVNITMGNNTQLLNTWNSDDLYRCATANGLADYNKSRWEGNLSDLASCQYTETTAPTVMTKLRGQAGNVLRLMPGIDICLPDRDLVPGSQGEKIVFQMSVDAKDTHTATCPSPVPNVYTLYIIFQYGGIFTLIPGQGALDMIPIKSASEALKAPIVHVPINGDGAFAQDVNGAGIWDDMKHWGTNIWDKVKKYARPVLGTAARAVGTAFGQPLLNYVGNFIDPAPPVGQGVMAGGSGSCYGQGAMTDDDFYV